MQAALRPQVWDPVGKGNFPFEPAEEGSLSTVAVIVLTVVVLLLAAMLATALRLRMARHAHHGPDDEATSPYRSHAEASRNERRPR
jgi:hypothetical protein